jgi:serine phosphatase RsbU (regulator of sigma subunit)
MTDGIFESENAQSVPLGIPAIKSLLANGIGNADKAGKHIMTAVREHLDKQPPDDDMCLVCLHRE